MAVLYPCVCAVHRQCKFLSHAHARTVLTMRYAVSAAAGHEEIPSSRAASSHLIPISYQLWNVLHSLKKKGLAGLGKEKEMPSKRIVHLPATTKKRHKGDMSRCRGSCQKSTLFLCSPKSAAVKAWARADAIPAGYAAAIVVHGTPNGDCPCS